MLAFFLLAHIFVFRVRSTMSRVLALFIDRSRFPLAVFFWVLHKRCKHDSAETSIWGTSVLAGTRKEDMTAYHFAHASVATYTKSRVLCEGFSIMCVVSGAHEQKEKGNDDAPPHKKSKSSSKQRYTSPITNQNHRAKNTQPSAPNLDPKPAPTRHSPHHYTP